MAGDPGARTIIIVSDDERLGRALELNLASSRVAVLRFLLGDDSQRSVPETANLVVLALSSYRSDPIAALAQASLARLVGRVPVLIISQHPVRPDSTHWIDHLHFPFDADQFCDRVQALLRDGTEQEGLRRPGHSHPPRPAHAARRR